MPDLCNREAARMAASCKIDIMKAGETNIVSFICPHSRYFGTLAKVADPGLTVKKKKSDPDPTLEKHPDQTLRC